MKPPDPIADPTSQPWSTVPSGHILDTRSSVSEWARDTVFGTLVECERGVLSNLRYSLPVNGRERAICVDPTSSQWLGHVYAMMATDEDFSYETRRAFARAGVTQLFRPTCSTLGAMNFDATYRPDTLKDAVKEAVKRGSMGPKTRATFSGWRDAVPVNDLVHLLCLALSAERCVEDAKYGRSGNLECDKEYEADLTALKVERALSRVAADEHGMRPLDYIGCMSKEAILEIVGTIPAKYQPAAETCLSKMRDRFSTTTTKETKTVNKKSELAKQAIEYMTGNGMTTGALELAIAYKKHVGADAPEGTAEVRSWVGDTLDVVIERAAGAGMREEDIRAIKDRGNRDSWSGLITVIRSNSSKWDALGGDNRFDFLLSGGASAEDDDASVSEAPASAVPGIVPADEKQAGMVNAVLAVAGMPSIEAINGLVSKYVKEASEAKSEAALLRSAAAKAVVKTGSVAASGAVPTGKHGPKSARDLFKGAKGLAKADLDKLAKLEVPCFEWSGPHPLVPDVDDNYIFRMDSLLPLLFSLVAGKKPWIQGHTGSGKTTLVMQVAARLGWPVVRVNLDSEISRLDLVGRDTLTTDPASGTTVTKWVDGVLPLALRGPHILVLDEIDFVRPDVSYVLQPILEGGALVLNENGGERVVPHDMFRIVATANTVGQGDEFGMYQGARPQSAAMLDRFSCFIKVPYLSKQQERELVASRHPTLPKSALDTIERYIEEHRQAFEKASILMPLSPRGIDSIAENCVTFTNVLGDEKRGLKMAFDVTLLAKASEQDRAVIDGLLRRVSK